MDPNGILTTSAEISIAIAGFSGIAVAIGPGRTGNWPEPVKLALSVLLVLTASTSAFAFAPLIFESAEISEAVAWSAASLVHAVWLSGIATYRMRQARRIPAGDRLIGVNVMPAVVAFVVALQVANGFWVHGAWPYLVSMVAMNLAGFAIFAILLFALASST